MLNQYPLWKYLLILILVGIGAVYALPNMFGDDPALQVSANRMADANQQTLSRAVKAIEGANLDYKQALLEDGGLLIRFHNTDTQLAAYEAVREALGRSYTVALNLAPATPDWLKEFNALPMYLGLDLRGGVHFLLDVDMEEALAQAIKRYVSDLRALLRENKIRYLLIADRDGRVEIKFRDEESQERAYDLVRSEYRDLLLSQEERDGSQWLYAALSEQEQRETMQFALKQNITTLRNRVNELGVAEPVIQQQGSSRIVVAATWCTGYRSCQGYPWCYCNS